MYNEQIEALISAALADGMLTEKEKQVLFKKAQTQGIDLDEFEMVLEARLYEKKQKQTNKLSSSTNIQSSKLGNVKKCPNCGAVLQSFNLKCPECGSEFRGVEANSTIKHLFDLLNEVEAESRENSPNLLGGLGQLLSEILGEEIGCNKYLSRKKAIIQNFPIPNTKEDILEFLTLALPLAKKPGFFDDDENKREMYPVWKAKCEQIIMKAKFLMKDEPKTLAEILAYGQQIGIKIK